MSAKNVYHDAVVDAHVADGWTITADPHRLTVGRRRRYVDLAGERAAVAAERAGERIAVEVQSFVSRSDIDDFHRAVGQYVVYRALMAVSDPDRVLYLAVPRAAFEGIFRHRIGEVVRASLSMRLLVFAPDTRRVVEWTS
ncbi:MAG: XisH family protein [Gemmataceae bacterium]|nr:XisH family protein [Gemmataceae bacterium]